MLPDNELNASFRRAKVLSLWVTGELMLINEVYMKVQGNSLELLNKLLYFVVSPPPRGGEMGVYLI
ncbi:MAG: hypothetical protein D3910_08665 [Candidatus Electrothrix sp. ATG2]|nr:hypothetical protein [Candidatus Electrothrix sp. ATG2]